METSIRVRVVCAAAVTAALVVGLGVVSASGSVLRRAARASVAARHRPPILKAGEEWSYVTWNFGEPLFYPCNAEFGVVGTQVCDGGYGSNTPNPRPEFGAWGFHDGHDGTVKVDRTTADGTLFINFFTPGAEIRGESYSKDSDHYTVEKSLGPDGWRIESPFRGEDYETIKAGDKGGPLHLDVRNGAGNHYVFDVYGYVVVVRHAR